MVTYTSAFLATANLLALAHAAPAQPVCFAVTTVITGSPIWVPADPTNNGGWGNWPSSSGRPSSVATTTRTRSTWSSSSTSTSTWTWTSTPSSTSTSWSTTSTSMPVITISVTPTTSTTSSTTTTTTTTTTTPAPPAATCDATAVSIFNADPSGSCNCDFTVSCNRHAPYTANTVFWERNAGEIINSLEECQQICNDNDKCQAAIWVNRDGAPSNEYLRCYQTQNLPTPDSDGYGQLSYKVSCTGSCASSYINN